MKKTLFAALLIAMMASCIKQEPEPADNAMAIVFDISIEASTRAGIPDDAENFSENDQIGVLGYLKETVEAAADFANPFLKSDAMMGEVFTYNIDTKFKSASGDAFFHHGKAHDFYAYYPHDLTINTLTAAAPTATLSVTTGTGIAQDVMHAEALATTLFNGKQTTNLTFTHRLSNVMFRVKKAGDADPNPVLTNVQFTMGHKGATYNVVTGSVTLDAPSTVTLSKDVNQTVSSTDAAKVDGTWMVLPTDMVSGISLTVDGKVRKAATPSKPITTIVGKITVITITIKPSGIEFTSATLDDWGDIAGSGEVGSVPSIGNYYYSDGSFSDDYKLPSDGVTLLGVVYAVDGTNGMLVEVTEGAAGVWGPNNVTTNASSTADGQANMKTINKIPNWATNYPGFKRCADKNAGDATDWYLPAMEELTELFVAYNTYGKPAFNALMTAAGGVEFSNAPYWSSSEYGIADGWVVNFGLGFTNSYGKGYNNRFRCVRKF